MWVRKTAEQIGVFARIAQRRRCLLLYFGVLSVILTAPDPMFAKRALEPLIVRDDFGGALHTRVIALDNLRKLGQRVEIHGKFCRSACTMYLGLAETCISENVKFGFHGPSSQTYGISLSPVEFERWSQVMASYYPEPIRQWFLRTGRNVTVGFYEITGRELIDIGVPKCL